MTTGEAYQQLLLLLQVVYEPREASNISNWVIEHITGFSGSQRILHKCDILTKEQETFLDKATSELLKQKPVQYVLNEAYFYRMKWYVNEAVLIPRPETEELVDWIIQDIKLNRANASLLDIGTGSGCIAIAIKKNMPEANVYAMDVSKEALQIAAKNAELQQALVQFLEVNILDEKSWEVLPALDYIISNPPYITQGEALDMNDNVIRYEPHLALFVPDDNPLLFYDAISTFGLQHLTHKGKLFFEINEVFGNEVVELLLKKGYRNIELRKDMQGKDRMIKAKKF